MSRVLVAGVDTSTQSTKVRVTDAATGEMVRFGQAKHPDGTSVNPEAWWQAFQEAAEQAGAFHAVQHAADGGRVNFTVIGQHPLAAGAVGDQAAQNFGLAGAQAERSQAGAQVVLHAVGGAVEQGMNRVFHPKAPFLAREMALVRTAPL